MSSTDDAWERAKRLNRLLDTPMMRESFYCGAKFALGKLADYDADEAIALYDELYEFLMASRTGAER